MAECKQVLKKQSQGAAVFISIPVIIVLSFVFLNFLNGRALWP
jgi:hypothetical protein